MSVENALMLNELDIYSFIIELMYLIYCVFSPMSIIVTDN